MHSTLVRSAVTVALLQLLACGSPSEECSGGCPAGQVCYYGVCVPDQDAGDVLDVPPADVPAEAEAEVGADADAEIDVGPACGNGVVDPGEECDGTVVETCTTTCGSLGSRRCGADCAWTECQPPPETCNGADDDCDGTCDDGFACCAGTTRDCVTRCGSTGTQACSAECLLAAVCTPPAEVCGNGRDDDCDGMTDEGCSTSNDTCTGARDISAGGTFTGSTTGYASDALPPRACVPADADPANLGPDAFFVFSLTATSDVFLHTNGSTFDTVLYASATCGSADLGCNDDVNPPGGPDGAWDGSSAVTLRNLAPGRYYVTLDGYDAGSAGSYALTLYITPHDTDGDRCGNPIQLANGATSIAGNTCGLSHEATGSCGGAAAEAIYWFSVPEGGRTVTLSSCDPTLTLNSVIYLRSDCDDPASQVACNNADAGCPGAVGAVRLSQALGAGLYFLFVDGAGSSSGVGSCGTWQLDVGGI